VCFRYPEYAIHVKELQFEYGSLEPFFCSVALYDVAEARKLSEDFNVTVSSMDALELLGSTTLVRFFMLFAFNCARFEDSPVGWVLI
jgi:hypothetical protein